MDLLRKVKDIVRECEARGKINGELWIMIFNKVLVNGVLSGTYDISTSKPAVYTQFLLRIDELIKIVVAYNKIMRADKL